MRGRLEGFGRVRFWCGFEIVRDEDGAQLISSRQRLALVQMPEGKPVRLPESWAKFAG